MKAGKTRIRRRQNVLRLIEQSGELERRATLFSDARHKAAIKPSEYRAARLELYQAAMAFASVVDGED